MTAKETSPIDRIKAYIEKSGAAPPWLRPEH